ncbi:hypothetical protein [Modicisalibacter luteus]|uniref:Uncharacterized protein n=1 Tax=Modicisalibacter luteus TaxID=453962 RepID=A0ABV7LWQ1_9GAMM|nr:hypothetical protein [Halomonas lutea]GHB03934.1 hypothetical protein GCM10007159_27270 [Halomonas lutea]
MQPPDAPLNHDGMPMEQRKAMLTDAIRQTQAGSEEDARDIIEALDETGRWYFKAFAALSKTRAAGLHPEPISFEEITAYMEVQELSVAPDAFIEVIQAMDRAWLDVNGG